MANHPSERVRLANELRVGVDSEREREVFPRLYEGFRETLKRRIAAEKKRYPALRGTPVTSLFHSLLQRLRSGRFREPIRGTGYLLAAAAQLVRGRNRAATARCRDPRREDHSDAVRDGLTAGGPDPAEEASRREHLVIANRVFQKLEEPDRVVLTLRQRDGLTFPEIAWQLKIETDTATKRYRAACRRLAELIQEEGAVS